MELLCDVRRQLDDALTSLRGRRASSMLDNFLVGMAIYINQATESYILLRKASKTDGSRLLIRPAIEAMIQILAVRKYPPLLYRIAYTEADEHGRWACFPSIKAGKDYDAEETKKLSGFKREYMAQFPEHTLVDQRLSLPEAAEAALGDKGYYDRFYRLYCKFTHPGLAAIAGSLDHFATEDSPTMAACVFCGLEAVASVGGVAPNLDSLRSRLFSMEESGSARKESP